MGESPTNVSALNATSSNAVISEGAERYRSTNPEHAPQGQRIRRSSIYKTSASVFRWVHIYVSMLSFAALIFFAVTGITLNHPQWFGGSEFHVADVHGELPLSTLTPSVDQLAIAETLRREHRLRGYVAEFEVSDFDCMVVFKGPGYAADAFIDRESGQYDLTVSTSSFVAVMNDLHKGRDSGTAWSWLIDASAAVMIVMSISGFGLLFYLKKRRVAGVLTAVVGTVALFLVWALAVP